MTSRFILTARKFLRWYQPRCIGFMFDPHRPFGLVSDDKGENLLNLGAAGGMFLVATAETFTEKDINSVFDNSYDRQEFLRWIVGLKHTLEHTLPSTSEQRALKTMDENSNAALYRLMGLPTNLLSPAPNSTSPSD